MTGEDGHLVAAADGGTSGVSTVVVCTVVASPKGSLRAVRRRTPGR
ncbi:MULTISPECIES: hypothetical protein [Streptomyces]|nr:hypothetical protein [Streptomyces venezuelae]